MRRSLLLSCLLALLFVPGTTAAGTAATGTSPTGEAEPEKPRWADPAATTKSVGGFDLAFDGYVRMRANFIEDDSKRTDFVGINDGFVLGNARLGVGGADEDLRFYIQLDGAVDRRDESNTSTGEVRVQLKDAWLGWEPCAWVNVRAGQFKPAFDAEELQSTRNLLFIDRAVESRGVHGVEGINVDGLSLERQVGVIVFGRPELAEDVPLAFAYYLSVTNGSGANKPINDNDSVAFFSRLELSYGEMATLGAGFYNNERTTGVAPDLLGEKDLGMAADLTLDLWGALLSGQFMRRTTTFPDVPGEPDRTAVGWHASVGYRAPLGISAAYRVASYDPTASFEAEDPATKAQLDVDELMYHTIGLTWAVPERPLKLQLNYTMAVENDARAIDNNRFDALVQIVF